MTESLLLALVAGVGGLLLAYWGARALVALTPSDVVRRTDTGLDGGVLAFTLVVSVATSVLFGLVPALHASKVDLIDALKQGGARSVVGGARRPHAQRARRRRDRAGGRAAHRRRPADEEPHGAASRRARVSSPRTCW